MNKLKYEYIKEQIEKEGYELISNEYINSKTKLKLKCSNKHDLYIRYNHFNKGVRCKKCYDNNQRYSYEYIKEQIEKEGYELISNEYKNSNTKLKVKCDKGHTYKVTWNGFQQGYRCRQCLKHSYEYIKEQIEKEGYELISNEYKNIDSNLILRCNNNHEYEVTYHNFQKGQRCPICSKRRFSYEFVNKFIEKEGYELISNEYKGNSKLKIKCPIGHEYEVTYSNFFHNESRCPKCNPSHSKQEKEIAEYLKYLNINIIENNRELIKPFELDIIIPNHKLAIEYCGLYWHSELYKDKNYHKNKLKLTNQAGYRLITIFEDEWIYKQDIVKNRLKYILGMEKNKIYARKCEIKEIDINQAKNFINEYHIQGYSNCKIKLGAFYNNKLVAVMTFSNANRRGSKGFNTFELNRFCTSCNVIGIASKLLKYFQRNYDYKKIITFADLRWSEGNLYKTIGFQKCYDVDLNYFYVNGNIRIHRFNFRKSVLKDKLKIFDPNLTEYENMKNNGWYRIWDCGNIKYEKNI